MGAKRGQPSISWSSLGVIFGISACASLSGENEDFHGNPELNSRFQQAGTAAPAAETQSKWPKTFQGQGQQAITLYPPQFESWKGSRIQARAVVSVQRPSSTQPVFGRVLVTADTQVDPQSREVTFKNVQLTKAQFPSAPELAATSLATLRDHSSELLSSMSSETLQSNLVIEQAEAKSQPMPVKDSPPRIVLSQTPKFLVQVDGAPVLRDAGASGVKRVINSRALILFDTESARYYIFMGDRWMSAHSLRGPWAKAEDPPDRLEDSKRIAVEQKQVDLFNEPKSHLMKKLADGVVPEIYVSTVPTEILETEGRAQYQSILGTNLLFVSNTEDQIFLDQKDQSYYVLISGRWYRSESLQGPWSHVPARQLPQDFARIPEGHRKGTVLASVPGTPQAEQARISNEAPQTARVDRKQAHLQVQYDGDPKFKDIEGTSLQYAVNSRTPVIRVNGRTYYALQSGVWFESASPTGEWVVTSRVPAAIYTIPPSSPIHYVTYVRVYDSTPDVVYVGYTPGYLGTYCCSDGVVVYGTGYYYPPWIGTYWIGPPVTFGIGITWGYGGGYYVSPYYYPWWGPWWWGPVYVVDTDGTPATTTVNQGVVYPSWGGAATQPQDPALYQQSFEGKPGPWSMPGEDSWSSAGSGTAPNAPDVGAWTTRQPPGAPAGEVSGGASAWNPPNSGSDSGSWGMGPRLGEAPSTAGREAPSPPSPPERPAPPPPPSTGDHAGAISQGAQSGGGWSANK